MKDESLNVFIESVTSDPLFAAEGMDVDRAEAVLDGIEETASGIGRVIAGSSLRARLFMARYPVEKHVVPIPFLRRFLESERERRRFLARPTSAGAARLLRSWQHTADQLAQSVSRYKNFHDVMYRLDINSGSTRPIQDMHGCVTTPDDIRKVLGQMRANAARLREEVAERKLLLEGKKTLDDVRRAVPPLRELPSYSDGELPEKYAHLYDLTLSNSFQFRNATILESFGPFAMKTSNFDGEPKVHNFTLHVIRRNTTGVVTLHVSALDVYLFLKIGDGRTPKQGNLHRTLVDLGFRWWYQTPTNLYTTRDHSFWTELATIADLRQRPHLPSETIIRQRSSMLDLLLGTCLSSLDMFYSNVRELVYDNGLSQRWYTLLYETHPSIFFLTFNGSVWRIPEAPHFLGSSHAAPEEQLYERAETALPQFSEGELERVMQGGRIREEERIKREKRHAWESTVERESSEN